MKTRDFLLPMNKYQEGIMKKKFLGMFMVAALSVSMLAGCSKAQETSAPESATEEATQEAAVLLLSSVHPLW